MSLPPGEVHLHEVMVWAQEQSPFLPHASHRLVLWFLCINAFRHTANPEGREPGDVLSAYASVLAIQRGTGLTDKTVRASLQHLQDQGYILAKMSPGRGQSSITIFWSEGADLRRADFRQGIRSLPAGFKRKPREAVSRIYTDNIVEFPNR